MNKNPGIKQKSIRIRLGAGALVASLLLYLFPAPGTQLQETYAAENDSFLETEDYTKEMARRSQTMDPSDAELLIPEDFTASEEKPYTVMIYMVGSNLESRLGNATKDIEEMEAAALSYETANVLVYTGGSRRWIGEVPCDRNCVLDLSKETEERIVAETSSNANMGSPQTLSNFVNFCTEYYPAEHFALIFWDHGGGPLWGYGSDELFDSDSLLLAEQREAMDNTIFAEDKKLDFVGFDACLMGSIESMELWKDYADYYIASEELEPGDGWDYTAFRILDTSEDSIEIAKSITDHYASYYENARRATYNPDITLSCVDLSRTGQVAAALNKMAVKMIKDVKSGSFSSIVQKRSQTKSFGLSENSKGYISYYYDLADLYDLSSQFEEFYPEQAAELKECIADAVICSSTNVDRAGGISIYFPYRNKNQYRQMRSAYKDVSVSSSYLSFLDLGSSEWMKSKYRNWDLGELVDSGDEYTLALNAEQRANTTKAYYTIVSKSSFGGYSSYMSRCSIVPDSDGVLHLPKKIEMISICSDDGERLVCPVTEVESDDYRVVYQTKNTGLRSDLTYANHITDLETQSVTALIALDMEEEDVTILSINDTGFDSELGGKSTIDASHWEGVSFSQHLAYTTKNADGTVLPFEEWNETGSVVWSDLPIDQGFAFEMISSKDTGLELYCQIELEDLNGEYYATKLAKLPSDDGMYVKEEETEKGTITFLVYEDHAEAAEYSGRDSKLILPEYVDGVPLTVIRKGAFGKLDLFNTYGTYPFETVEIPDTVTEIGSSAFYGCSKLKEIRLPSGLQTIGSLTFCYCGNLESVTLPETLSKIGKNAFAYCSSLKEISLPAALSSIEEGAFMGCKSLEAFLFEEENTSFIWSDHSLYNSDGTVLLACTAAEDQTLTIAEGTQEIAYGACALSAVENIVFPESLKKIGNYAFYGCNRLKAPVFPSGIEEIGMHAFDTSTWALEPENISALVQTIEIGPGLQYLGEHAFDLFLNKTFTVDPGNKRFSVSRNSLLNGAGDTVLSAGINQKGQIMIPEGTVSFDFDLLGFLDNINTLSNEMLVHLYLPESVSRFPGNVHSYDTDDLIIHCMKGSAAETFAMQNAIPFSNEMSVAYVTTNLLTEKGVLTARIYTDYVMITRYKGEDEILEIPSMIENRPVKIIGDGERAISVNGYYFGIDGESSESRNLKTVILPEGVEELSAKAMDGFSYVNKTSVVLPSTLKSIGESALTGCYDLKIPEGVERFGNRFTNMELQEGFTVTPAVRYIDPEAFSSCMRTHVFSQEGENETYAVIDGILYSADKTKLICYPQGAAEDCIVPEGTETIGERAFYQSYNLNTVTLPATVKTIEAEAFASSWHLKNITFEGNELDSLGVNAFRYCNELVQINLPVVEVISENAFYGCEQLTEIKLREGVQVIGNSAFAKTGIVDPSLPISIVRVGEDAYYTYSSNPREGSPESLFIGKNVSEIGHRAFTDLTCSAYNVSERNEHFASINGLLLDKAGNSLLSCPSKMAEEAWIPDGVTAIVNYAFDKVDSVTKLHIPESVEYIGSVNFSPKRIQNSEGVSVYKYTVTFYCKKNSYAHEFALNNEIPFVLE